MRSNSGALSNTEALILEAFLENGCSNQDLAQRFGTTEATVKAHMYRIMNATGASSRTELAVNVLHKRYARAVA